MTLEKPRTESDVAEIVMDARTARTPLAIEGGGTRAGLGRPVTTPLTLSTAQLSGITLYEPAEMVISARAGTPVSDHPPSVGGQLTPNWSPTTGRPLSPPG